MQQKGSVLLVLLIVITVVVGGGFWYVRTNNIDLSNVILQKESLLKEATNPTNNEQDGGSQEEISVYAQNLDTPWGMAFLPDGTMLVTERKGTVQKVDKNGRVSLVSTISQSKEIGEGGLLGIAVHPKFVDTKYVYVYYTYRANGENTLNRVSRFTYENSLKHEKIILDAIPGAGNHNGGRIQFGSDGMLYIGTGDAQEPSKAQDKNSLAGKILRINDDGSIPSDNPFGNAVYSYGHRNVQGLAWDNKGQLWATEHGRSGVQAGLDEVNKIEKGKNYGWPDIQGDETRSGMERAFMNSGDKTWAPAGMAFYEGFVFVGLRGAAVYHIEFNGNGEGQIHEHFTNTYGRIRDIVMGPDGMAYIATSNKDGRGLAKEGDDKILRMAPSKL